MSRRRLFVERLEQRLVLSGVAYTNATDLLEFTADVGGTDIVTVTSPLANRVVIQVGNLDSITLAGDAVANPNFVLSTTVNLNDTLTINTGIAPAANFNVNLGDQADTLTFGLGNATHGVAHVNLQGDPGSDIVTINTLMITGNLTVASETINLGGIVTASGNVSLTAVNSLMDGADNDVADISGAVVTLTVTGAGNMIGAGSADFLEVDAATRLDAATNNGLIALKNVSGNLPLGTINAGTNFIFLTARNGAITDANGANVNLTAANGVSLTTTGNSSAIGTAGNAIETEIGTLNATTFDGGIFIADSNAPGMIINNVLALEGGQTPFIDSSNQIVVFDPVPSTSNPHPGAHDVSISAQGNILFNTVTAPDSATITSGGMFLDVNQGSNNVIAQSLTLIAQGVIGQDGDAIETMVETFSASTTNGSIFLAPLLAGTAASVVAGGAGNDVSIAAAVTSLRIQTISALGDVTVSNLGGSLLDDNGAAVNVTGQVVSLTGNAGIGTTLDPLETNTSDLRATASDAMSGVTPAAPIFINNANGGLVALNSVAAKTNAGDVAINFLGGTLSFIGSTKVLTGSGAAVTFETTSGHVRLALVDAGVNAISITAAGAIVDDVNDALADLRGGTVTLVASTGIGAAGNEIDTDIATLIATTSGGGVFIREANAITLNASTTAGDVDVRNTTGTMTVGLVSASGQVTLQAVAGAILDGNGVNNNLIATTLSLVASSGIGSGGDGLETSVNSLTANGGAGGGLLIANNKALTLNSASATGGTVSISATGSMTLMGPVITTGQNATLTAAGALIDANGGNDITAAMVTLKASKIGDSGNKIDTTTAAIAATTTTGGIFLSNTGATLALDATAVGAAAEIDIDTTGNIVLGVATAQGDTVKLLAGGSITDGNDPPITVNVTAKKVDISAPGGIGTALDPVEMDVDVVVNADGGVTGAFITFTGPLLLTETALEAAGTGTLTFDAESITIEDIADNTATIAAGRSLVLRTPAGAIVFLDAADTIETSGAGTITVQAGAEAGIGEIAVAVLGNLKTAGGNILVEADRTITIGLLDAGARDVTVKSGTSIIIDGNGPALNIIAGSTTLSGAGRTDREAELDETFRIAEAAANAAEAAAEQVAAEALGNGQAILDAEVATQTGVVEAAEIDAVIKTAAYVAKQTLVNNLGIAATAADVAALAATTAATAALLVAAPAQGVPLVGDLGAFTVQAAIQVVANVLEGVSSGLAIGLTVESIALIDIGYAATVADFVLNSAKDRLALGIVTHQAFAEGNSITLAAAASAAIIRDASERIRDQAVLARNQVNVIGTFAMPLGLQVAGVINVTAGATDSFLQVVGTTAVDLIQTTGSVTLISTGSISDADAGGGADVLGTGLRIVGVGGIGTAADPLETRVATLNAENTSGGDIAIANTAGAPAALDVTGVSNAGGGDVIISNQGSTVSGQGITVSGPISATGAGAEVMIHSGSPLTIGANITSPGAILLEAGETADTGDDLTVTSDVTIESTGSSVTLRAGDDVLVSAGSTIRANTTITITADFHDDAGDTTGANVVVGGTLVALAAFIGVDAAANDNDTFTITPSVSAPITADAEDGIDTLNFIADGLPVTIIGNQITAQGRAPVTFVNFEFVNLINASGGGSVTLLAVGGVDDDLILTGTGQKAGTFTLNGGVPISFSGVDSFSFSAGDLNDTVTVSPYATSVLPWNTAVTIDGGTGTDRITYNNVAGLFDTTSVTAITAQAGHIDAPGVTSALHSQLVSFSGVEDITANANPGEDEKLTVNLRDTGSPDTANLLFAPTPAADDLQLVGLFDLIIDTENYVGLTLNGRGGDDSFHVTPGPIPVFVDGGDPIGVTAGDTIHINPPGNYVLEPGPASDEGGLNADLLQRVSWDHIEATSVTGGGSGTSTVLGTNGNDVITITVLDAGDYTVSVNDGSATLITNQSVIKLDGQSGIDTFIVKTLGTQTVTYTPTGIDAATIDVVTLSTMILSTGVEQMVYQGLGGDTLTINGTGVDDDFLVDPTNGGSGSHSSNLAPAFQYTGATAVNVTGDTGGFDLLTVLGSEGVDTVTSAADGITIAGAGTVTIGANIDRVDVTTFGSNDSVDLTGVTLPTIIRGGDGADTLIGSPQEDILFGGLGNDILIGGGGNDQEYGEDGNDRFGDLLSTGNGAADDPGDDFLFGGDGTDEFIWESGDGNDIIEGGDAGTDILRIFGDDGVADILYVLPAPGAPTRANVVRGAETVDTSGVEQLVVTGRTGGDTLNVADLGSTEIEHVVLDVTPGDTDNITVNGRATHDNIFLSTPGAGRVNIVGLEYDVRLLNVTTADRLTVFGNEGDDTIKANAGVENTVLLTLDGGDGNDSLAGAGVLIGGPGDDFLEGGAGNDQLSGNDGQDTMVGGLGNDTFDGGPGFDTILIRGTFANDVVDVFQNAPGAAPDSGYVLNWSLNGVAQPDTIAQDTAGSSGAAGTRPTVEEVRIEAGLGSDLIRIGVSDAYSDLDASNGAPDQSLRFNVLGDAPKDSDRLVVRDDGLGDLVVLREAFDGHSGSITVGPLAAINYDGIEKMTITPLNSISGGTGSDGLGRVFVFKPDPHEFNDARVVSTHLGIVPLILADLSITPGTVTLLSPFGPVPGDEDWFEFMPEKTGTYRFDVLFEQIGTLGNGRAGLPNNGNLDMAVYDVNGTLIDEATSSGDNESVSISMLADRRYFLRVFGSQNAINMYDINIVEVDLFGPVIDAVAVTGKKFDLFDPKPSIDGPTPPIISLTISVSDPPPRAPGDLYPALEAAIAEHPGHYLLVGDHTGIVAIAEVIVANNQPVVGVPATATIELRFAEPLPDDRYTLRIADALTDPAQNRLDGETDAVQPLEQPQLPTGDGMAGGGFEVRFTVDSRPEIAVTASTRIYVDINGNYVYDPEGSGDTTNKDLIFRFGLESDAYFAGNFAPANAAQASGFDKLGVFGFDPFLGQYRFLLDFDHNGVADFVSVVAGLRTSGLPVAGDFAPAHPGDEIGLFMGDRWHLDTNGDNVIDLNVDLTILTGMRGIPAVGDVNGNGQDDLIIFDAGQDVYFLDLNRDGIADDTIAFGIPGFVERPVIGDLNLDGVDDIGFWVAGSPQNIGEGKAEWHFLLSDRQPQNANQPASTLFDPYSPDPLGNDLFAHFGDRYSLPAFGNFDPPVVGDDGSAGAQLLSYSNTTSPLDVNDDGHVTPLDALLVINQINRSGPSAVPSIMVQYDVPAPYWDVTGDRRISPLDALMVINWLNQRGSQGEGEGESSSGQSVPQAAAIVGRRLVDSTGGPTTRSWSDLPRDDRTAPAALSTLPGLPDQGRASWGAGQVEKAEPAADAWDMTDEFEELLTILGVDVADQWWR